MPKFDPTACKTQLKLAMSRIKLQKNKRDNLVKTGKQEVAVFLKAGKEGDARIRVENVIKDDFTIETLELIEMFCELLMSRLSSIQTSKECPADLKEAICTIIYAAPRLDIQELNVVREQFAAKFGKPFGMDAMNNKDGCVNARIVHKLGILTPENYLVYQYLTEIAKSYGLDWKAPQSDSIPAPQTSRPQQNSQPASLSFPSPPTHTSSQQQSAPSNQSFPTVPDVPVPVFNASDLPGGGGLNFPSPPSNSNTIPSFPTTPSSAPKPDFDFPTPPSHNDDKSGGGVPDFDELSARFERLKKKDQ